MMDDGELDFLNQDMFSIPKLGDLPSNTMDDSFFDDIFNDTHACTHTHTCNPPGPDDSHTHTCFHMHTKIVPAPTPSEGRGASDDTAESNEKSSKKRPVGNREAVRKYREKKKARAASLEDEVVRLTSLNQQLMKRLQGQAALEAEIVRLKCLLVDFRGRIDGEIGSFPYHKTPNGSTLPSAYVMNPCNVQQCDDQVYCPRPRVEEKNGEGAVLNGRGFNGCDYENLQCVANTNSGTKDLPGCELGSTTYSANSISHKKRKGTGG